MATKEPRKARVACFIDGFNLYHAVDNLRNDAGDQMHYLKWVDLWSLGTAFIPKAYELRNVYYFSAYATWRPGAYSRHRAYTAILEDRGVTLVMGKFKDKDKHCKECGARWKGHEEKESDVNFGVRLIHEAHLGTFDHALLITSDSDLCPPIRLVAESFRHLTLQVLTPPNSYNLAHELRGIAPTVRIRLRHLHQNLLPATVKLRDGTTVERPDKYQPPADHF